MVSDEVIKERLAREKAKAKDAFKPKQRSRVISKALRAYAGMVTSADRGAVRILPDELE